MSRYAVKKVDGMWEIFPIRSWLGRALGMSRLKSTEKWIWVTRFDTHAEALEHAEGWYKANRDGIFPYLPLKLRPGATASDRRFAAQWWIEP